MALKKSIREDTGIILKYHRIKTIKNVVNDDTYLEILSYADEVARESEQNKPKYSPRRNPVYSSLSIEKMDYNDTLTIEQAYDYLKTLERFSDAEDI